MSPDTANALTLRPARRGDAALLLRFIEELADYERLSHEVAADEARLERTLFDDQPAAEAVIAEWDGMPAGFALFFRTYSTFLARPGLYVEDLFVTPTHRGRGIGKALLRHVAGLALERGCGRLEWSVLDWNRPAIEFYERAGARPLSTWTMYRVTGDALAGLAGPAGDSAPD